MTKSPIVYGYERDRSCRTVQADGVWGGLTGTGLLAVNVWHQRPVVPSVAVQALDETGNRDGPERTQPRPADVNPGALYLDFVRTFEVELMFMPAVAKSVAEWLLARVAEAEAAVVVPRADAESMQ